MIESNTPWIWVFARVFVYWRPHIAQWQMVPNHWNWNKLINMMWFNWCAHSLLHPNIYLGTNRFLSNPIKSHLVSLSLCVEKKWLLENVPNAIMTRQIFRINKRFEFSECRLRKRKTILFFAIRCLYVSKSSNPISKTTHKSHRYGTEYEQNPAPKRPIHFQL